MIGLSLPLCVRDILAGKVKTEDVQYIYCFLHSEPPRYSEQFDGYRRVEWADFSNERVDEVLNSIMTKIVYIHLSEALIPVSSKLWVVSEAEISWKSRPLNQGSSILR